MIYCVFSLESPRWGDSNENSQHTFMLKKIGKNIPIMPPNLVLWLTPISSSYPCLEHIFVVPIVFEPLKFYSSSIHVDYMCRVVNFSSFDTFSTSPNYVSKELWTSMHVGYSNMYGTKMQDYFMFSKRLIWSGFSHKRREFSCRDNVIMINPWRRNSRLQQTTVLNISFRCFLEKISLAEDSHDSSSLFFFQW